MTPLSTSGQLMLRHDLSVSPTARLHRYTDYWGTAVEAFDVHIPHHALTRREHLGRGHGREVAAGPGGHVVGDGLRRGHRSLVRVPRAGQVRRRRRGGPGPRRRRWPPCARRPPRRPRSAWPSSWCATTSPTRRGPPTCTPRPARPGRRASGCARTSATPRCRCCAPLGIPGRYVSGYVHTEDAEIGVPVIGESHAWVEAWNGGWEAHDPTNGRAVAAAHVLVARGRDYQDVSPLTGIYAGPLSADPGGHGGDDPARAVGARRRGSATPRRRGNLRSRRIVGHGQAGDRGQGAGDAWVDDRRRGPAGGSGRRDDRRAAHLRTGTSR